MHGPDGKLAAIKPASGRTNWLNVIAPDALDIERLKQLTDFDAQFIEHALDQHECPRIEGDDEVTLLVIRAPYIETGRGEPRYSTIPIGIIFGPDMVTTICKVDDPMLENILTKCSCNPDWLRSETIICKIIKDVAMLFMTYLKDISTKIQDVEQHLSELRSNDDLKFLLTLQKSVTYFHSALKTNDFIIDRIIRKGLQIGKNEKLAFTDEELDGLDNALTETRQGIYMSKIFTEVLTSISNVYSSIISNSVNQIMKVLTSMTVIIMIPTFITSMYGMNVQLPFQQDSDAFILVSVFGMLFTGIIILAMKVRRIL